jgi:two-component system, NtrC family, response regulator HupR/HoxA
VMRALALGEGNMLDAELLSSRLRVAKAMAGAGFAVDREGGTLKDRLDRLEGQVIARTMERHKDNKTRVAEELGLTRVGLRMKLARLGLNGDDE